MKETRRDNPLLCDGSCIAPDYWKDQGWVDGKTRERLARIDERDKRTGGGHVEQMKKFYCARLGAGDVEKLGSWGCTPGGSRVVGRNFQCIDGVDHGE